MIPCYDFQPQGVKRLPEDVQMDENDSFEAELRGSFLGQGWLKDGWPIVPGDAGRAGTSGLHVLLIVMGVDVGFFGLLLQDLPEVVSADASEECSHLVGFLDHPLKKEDIKKTAVTGSSVDKI